MPARANDIPSKLPLPHTSRGKAKRLDQPGTGTHKLENFRSFRTALRVAVLCRLTCVTVGSLPRAAREEMPSEMLQMSL